VTARHTVCRFGPLGGDQRRLRELSERVGISIVNLSVLKNDRARAVRFSTLVALCDALDCQPGALFSVT